MNDITKFAYRKKLASWNMRSELPYGYVRLPPPYRHVLVSPIGKRLRSGRWVIDRRRTLAKAVSRLRKERNGVDAITACAVK